MTPAQKNVSDQVREIAKLVEDATDALRQARLGLETLAARLGDEAGRPAGSLPG